MLIIALIGVLLYGHTLQAPFYLDDFINIRDKLHAISSLSVRELIDASFESYVYRRPLPNLTFALNYYIHGLRLPGYHIVNIIIHVINCMLLYLFLFKTLTLPGFCHKCEHPGYVAILASLLWFVNPMQIQSVTYIVQRMTSMGTLFFLCSFLCYLYGRLAQRMRARVALFLLSVMCWVMSMASKEIALTLPWLIFFYEWFFFQDLDRTWLKRSAIYIVTGFTIMLAWVYFVYEYSPLSLVTAISQHRQYTALERFLTQGRVIFFYISLLIYPHPSRLTLNHDIPVSHGLLDPLTTLLSFAALAAIFAMTILAFKRHRLMVFCIIWFFGNLAIEALTASIELVFEHRAYIPSMLVFLPFVLFLFRIVKPRIGFSIICALIMIFGYWTFQRNALWNNPVAFWEDAAGKPPNHFRAHANLGVSYLDAKQYDRALGAFKKALSLNPTYPTEIYTNIGMLYLDRGRQTLARKHLERALALNPNNFVALDLIGTLYRKQKNYKEALKHYGMAIKINPNFALSHHNIGILYLEMGELDNAVSTLQHAIMLRPNLAEAHSSLGLALARQGRYDLAIPTLRKAIKIDDKNQEALFNLATAYHKTGQYEMAAQVYKSVLKMNPGDVEALHNLGLLYFKHLKDIKQARLYLNRALATDPGYDQAASVQDILSKTGAKP